MLNNLLLQILRFSRLLETKWACFVTCISSSLVYYVTAFLLRTYVSLSFYLFRLHLFQSFPFFSLSFLFLVYSFCFPFCSPFPSFFFLPVSHFILPMSSYLFQKLPCLYQGCNQALAWITDCRRQQLPFWLVAEGRFAFCGCTVPPLYRVSPACPAVSRLTPGHVPSKNKIRNTTAEVMKALPTFLPINQQLPYSVSCQWLCNEAPNLQTEKSATVPHRGRRQIRVQPQWKDDKRRNAKETCRKTSSNAIPSTVNHIRSHSGLNLRFRGEKPVLIWATNIADSEVVVEQRHSISTGISSSASSGGSNT